MLEIFFRDKIGRAESKCSRRMGHKACSPTVSSSRSSWKSTMLLQPCPPVAPNEPLYSAAGKEEAPVPTWTTSFSSQKCPCWELPGPAQLLPTAQHSVPEPGPPKCPQVLGTSLPLGERFPWSSSSTWGSRPCRAAACLGHGPLGPGAEA